MQFLLSALALAMIMGCNGTEPTDSLEYVFEQQWELSIEDNGWRSLVPPTIVSDSSLLIAAAEGVQAINTINGTIIWSSELENAGQKIEQFVINGDQLFGHRNNNLIYSISLLDGSTNWEKEIDSASRFGFQMTGNEQNYFFSVNYQSTGESGIHAVDLNGTIVKTVLSDHMPWLLEYFDGRLISSYGWFPTSHASGQMICYSSATLDTLWYIQTEGSLNMCATKIVAGVIYTGTVWGEENNIYAINLADGDIEWSAASYGCYDITIDENRLYYDGGGSVHSLSLTDGMEIWNTPMPNPDENGSIAFSNDFVYILNYGVLYILDADNGEIIHTQKGGDNLPIRQFSLSDNAVFLQTSLKIYAYSLMREIQD